MGGWRVGFECRGLGEVDQQARLRGLDGWARNSVGGRRGGRREDLAPRAFGSEEICEFGLGGLHLSRQPNSHTHLLRRGLSLFQQLGYDKLYELAVPSSHPASDADVAA